jgi:hypothetical protein
MIELAEIGPFEADQIDDGRPGEEGSVADPAFLNKR